MKRLKRFDRRQPTSLAIISYFWQVTVLQSNLQMSNFEFVGCNPEGVLSSPNNSNCRRAISSDHNEKTLASLVLPSNRQASNFEFVGYDLGCVLSSSHGSNCRSSVIFSNDGNLLFVQIIFSSIQHSIFLHSRVLFGSSTL